MPYQLTEANIADIAIGTGFLGSGGGGDTKIGEIITRKAIRDGIIPNVEHLQEIADDSLVVAVGAMGAPTVLAEKLPSKEEGINAIQKMEEILQEKISYVIPAEIGGTNGLYAIYIAAQAQKIIINGDCMGRAFPEINMVTPNIYGKIRKSVAVLANGQESHVLYTENLHELEVKGRQKAIEMGGIATLAYLPMRGKQAREYCIPHSISVAKKIGGSLRIKANLDLLQDLNNILQEFQYGPLEKIANGKILDLQRNIDHGFNKGWAIIEDSSNCQKIKIDFQNENLRAINLKAQQELALVPKIITILDNEFKPVSCECLRIGLEVSVVTLQVPEILRTAQALNVLVPKAFKAHKAAHSIP